LDAKAAKVEAEKAAEEKMTKKEKEAALKAKSDAPKASPEE